jgi:hypothetical protein
MRGGVGLPTPEFTDQAYDDCYDAIAQDQDCADLVCWQQLQPLKHGQMAMELRVRSEGDLETANELCSSAERVSFGNVGWHRESSATNLVDHSEVSAQLGAEGQEVRLVGEVLGGTPRVKTLEPSHSPT